MSARDRGVHAVQRSLPFRCCDRRDRGTTSFELSYSHEHHEIRGSIAVPDTCDAEELRVYLRLPDTLKPRAVPRPDELRIEEEQPVAANAPKCPVLVGDQPRGTIRFSVPVNEAP